MILERLQEQVPGAVTDHHDFRGDLTAVVAKDHYLAVVDALFADGFQQLVDLTAVDWPERNLGGQLVRFDVVLHLLNLTSQERLRLKVRVAENEPLPSLTGRFHSADWAEREVFDLFGIVFDGHPNLSRLLTWEDFPGHALRKDFPLDGGDPFCMADSTAPYTH
ncbi:MAG TPA: NADH-quinone oxidoreductase subunit C [Holophagaceae bacterium]|jgi:NADH-quinone oxidoreductase subunit C|nr:NADH-quinone oxidoreductase subunit C [Holophagaceae bacterium]